MKNRISIIVPYRHMVDFDMPIKDVRIADLIRFNSCTLIGAESSLSWNAVLLHLAHPEFNTVPDGYITPLYWYDEARKQFPYLFVDTNPLLYRKFRHNNGISADQNQRVGKH